MMKTLEKRMAAREGFTLVELIVVIAILAILAAVAYPVYTGYISRAHDASALEQLGSIATAVQGLAAGEGKTVKVILVETQDDGSIKSIHAYSASPATADNEIKLKDADLQQLLGVTAVTSITLDAQSDYAKGATWNGSSWEAGAVTIPQAAAGG